jgi:hypothetical protein
MFGWTNSDLERGRQVFPARSFVNFQSYSQSNITPSEGNMANRALAAKAERARGQGLELGRLEGTKACYLAHSKSELRAMLAQAQANTTNTRSVRLVETYRKGNGKLQRPDNWNVKRGNFDQGLRPVISGAATGRTKQAVVAPIRYATGDLLIRGGKVVG